jgi:type I restriction enzyme, S subunit
MYATTVSDSQLELRIDPAFYHPSHLMDVDNIMRFPVERLDSLRDNLARMSYGVLKPRFENNSPYRMVRIQDFRDPFLDVDSAVGINQSQFAEFHRSECKAGDILIAIAGYVGRAAIVPECLFKLNINQHIARFRPSSTYNTDPYYLISYLISGVGRRQLCRYVSGSVQTGINLEDLRELLIPQPDQLVRKYIGDKVRQAERLRTAAQKQEATFSDLMGMAYPEIDEPFGGLTKHGRAPASLLDGTLNPGEFNPDRMKIREYLKQHGGKVLKDVATVETPVVATYSPSDLYIGLDSIGSSCGTLTPSTIANEAVVGAVRTLPEGPVISKLRPYLNKVAYIPTELAGALGSTELLCVRPNEQTLSWYLYGVLKLRSTVRQLNPVSTGSTHPRVSRDDVLGVFIPWLGDSISAGNLLRCAQRDYFTAERLITAAKVLVEALIDGRLSEDDLKTAEQQLEQGNRELDRAILSRITVSGVDTAGAPSLFIDLEALYAAIDEAERAHTDGEAS